MSWTEKSQGILSDTNECPGRWWGVWWDVGWWWWWDDVLYDPVPYDKHVVCLFMAESGSIWFGSSYVWVSTAYDGDVE